MKIFWSWQSDIEGDVSRHFIKECIKKAIEELKNEAIFDERVEIDHDTKDVPGSPPIVDTILEKISNSTVFIADLTPVAVVKNNKKKVINSNVAIEIGYAIATVGNNNIVTIMNDVYGTIETLPFDLRYKRGPITYSLKEGAIKEEIKAAELQLIAKLKLSLKNYADKHAGKNFPSINLDTYGLGIFFDPSKPLLRLPSDGWDGVKDKEYSFIAPSSYIYIKIIPSSSLNLKKAEINKALYDGNFQVFPLLSKPDRSPDVNKYGSIISKFKGDGSQEISDFVQVLDNGSIITISTSYLFFSDNRLHLIDIKNGLEKFLTSAVSVMKSLTDDQMDIE